jgi:hypothetical protein
MNARARRKYGYRGRPATPQEIRDRQAKVGRRRNKTKAARVARAIARSRG